MNVLITVASLVGFVALTAGTAVFVAAEFSLTALERSTVDAHARDGDRRARMVAHAHRTLSFQLSGAQLGITITTLITGYLAEPVLARFISPIVRAMGATPTVNDGITLALALVIATSISMIFGELVPKNLAISAPLPTARATAGLQAGFSLAFKWVIRGLNGAANAIVRQLGVEPAEELRSARSPRELGSLVRNSAEQGSIDESTAVLVDRSLQFGERTAEEFMTPRVKIETLAATDTVADLIEVAARTGFSRFPVIDGDLDDTLGVVHIKHAFTVAAADRRSTFVRDLAQPVATVPASLDGDAVMDQVHTDSLQVAMVVDEYGGTAGMVTMEDLIEEIVGDVRDEHDRLDVDVVRVSDGWLCTGLLRIDEVNSATGYAAPEGEYDTLGGLVLMRFERIPEAGDEVVLPPPHTETSTDEVGGWVARVTAMDGRRIDRVLVRPVPPEEIARLTTEAGRS